MPKNRGLFQGTIVCPWVEYYATVKIRNKGISPFRLDHPQGLLLCEREKREQRLGI